MKIVIFEGLPMIGKSTLINYIKSLSIENIYCVDELIIPTEELKQDTFMKNDLEKFNKYKDGLIFIDKAMINTLSYNEMLEYLNGNKDLNRVFEWFEKYAVPFYKKDNVYTIYLKNKKKRLRERNSNTPHGSIANQNKIEEITINNIKKYCKNYEIIDYKQEEMVGFVHEIINKYM